MKRVYTEPTIEIVELSKEDVITTSTVGIFGGKRGGDLNKPWETL